MKRVLLARLLCAVGVLFAVSVFTVGVWTVDAQVYENEPSLISNSGSVVWAEVQIDSYGRYVLLMPSNTDKQAFAFYGSTGYQMINNTTNTISGTAYHVGSSGSNYNFRFQSWGTLQLYVPNGNYYTWRDCTITNVYGTSLNFVDNLGDRENDYYKGWSVSNRDLFTVILAGGSIILVCGFLLWRITKGRRRY